MKAEYINPFIKASTEVLRTIVNVEFKTGAPYLKQSPLAPDNVMILVGITGEIRGQVTLSMKKQVAMDIASSMMMGMPVDELDEMSKSALSELGNMIMGNTATLLFNNGINIDITPPTLMMGDNLSISVTGMTTVGIPLISDLGSINLDISAKE
jgi:chemotaxis protein CheX